MDPADLQAKILTTVQKVLQENLFALPETIAEQVATRLAKPATGPETVPVGAEPPAGVSAESSQAMAAAEARLHALRMEGDRAQVALAALLEDTQVEESRLAAGQSAAVAAQEAVTAAENRLAAAESEHARLVGEAFAESARLKEELTSLAPRMAEARRLLAQAETFATQQEETKAKALALDSREAALQGEQLALRSRQASLESQAATLASQQAELAGHKRAGEEARALSAKLWPGWLRTGELADWRTRLENALALPDASPAPALLFAAVHTYQAALQDPDPKTLLDGLRDLGRRLYGWLRDLDYADLDAARAAGQWAAAVNAECEGRSEVEVPVPGNAANNQWMLFQPRGGSSPDVVSVRSWCVRDAQQRPIHRAEVSV